VRPEAGAAQASPARRAVDALVGRRSRLTGTVYLCLDLSASMAEPGKMQQLLKGSRRDVWLLRGALSRPHGRRGASATVPLSPCDLSRGRRGASWRLNGLGAEASRA